MRGWEINIRIVDPLPESHSLIVCMYNLVIRQHRLILFRCLCIDMARLVSEIGGRDVTHSVRIGVGHESDRSLLSGERASTPLYNNKYRRLLSTQI